MTMKPSAPVTHTKQVDVSVLCIKNSGVVQKQSEYIFFPR